VTDSGRIRENELPRPLGKYVLVRILGQGAMGVVYEALDTALDRKVALKLMLPSPGVSPDESAIEEAFFVNEAQMCARLEKHPHIVTIYEAGVLEGRRFIAMEFLSAKPLTDWAKERRPSLRSLVAVLRDVSRAVHHAHEGGVLHRDLKPKNVLIDAQGRPVVTDFGMAKRADGSGKSTTSAGTVVGTPSYMSPEQAQGLKRIDRRTDVYSLGAMLYEMLTGKPPFPGEMTIVALMKIVQDPIPTPSAVSPEWAAATLDKSIETICMKALSKIPDDRFPTAAAFADQLGTWLGESTQQRARRPAAPAPLPAPSSTRRTLVGTAAGLVLLAGTAAFLGPRPKPAAGPPVELVGRVDPARDTVSGTWTLEKGLLASSGEVLSRIEIPWRPAEEYELRIVFSPLKGGTDVAFHLNRAGRPFVVVLGPEVRVGEAEAKLPGGVETGRFHSALVRVGGSGAELELDERKLLSWTTDWSLPAVPPEWALRDASLLGLGVRSGRLEVKSVQETDLAGRGAPSRR
jgi:tRNA A-37 threonylcarbamoyl transferase component Bud32